MMKPKCPIYLPLIPAIADVFSSTFAYASLTLVSASVWQVTRGGNIITIGLFYRIFMKKSFSWGGIVGCTLAFLGITAAQLIEIFLSPKDSSLSGGDTSEQLIGVVLLVLSILTNTIILVYEKHLFNKYQINPLKMVFLEGAGGLAGISVFILLLQTVIKCPDWGSLQQKCILYEG